MNKSKRSKWLVAIKQKPNAKIRLFCLPFAGGNVLTYADWPDALPDFVELVAVQPPGRAERFFEKPFTSMNELIDELFPHVEALMDKPYAIFGHSLGSRVAYELVCKLRDSGYPEPLCYFASGSEAPHLPRTKEPIHALPQAEFINALRDYDGTPEAVLENEELMELCFPTLRADFEIAEKHRSTPGHKINSPLSVFSGTEDRNVSDEGLQAWNELFVGNGEITKFSGGHFFLDKECQSLLERVSKTLIQSQNTATNSNI